ncbi:Protein mlp1 [Neurospora sp. IMI 360204]|nr:Protein mlp1 [Neurospora sp. IMI 360204]
MAAAEVDVGYLSTQVGVPEPDLNSALTAPTPDLVKTIFEAVIAKIRALEEDKFQLGIELEGAIRSSESRCEQFKATTDKALKEVDELQNELQTLKSSGSTSLSEIETLRARIASLETSNRETLAIVDSKTQANATLAEELQTQHKKILKLNQEVTSLNQAVQTAQTTANSAKYREEALKQELEHARRTNDWLDNELKTKNAEAIKFRKEKGARIAELQRLNEDANSTIESLTRSEQVLRKRLQEAQEKAEEALTKVQQLQEAAARTEEGFKQELESAKRLVELKDQQSETHRNRLKEVELRLEQIKDDHADEIRRIRRELEQEKEDHAQTELRAQELQNEVDRIKASGDSRGRSPATGPQTPKGDGSFTAARAASPFGTPLSIRGRAGQRATDALEELYNVKGQLAGEKRRCKKLQEELDDAVAMLEAKMPEIDELSAESERLKNETIQMSQLLEQSYEERDLAVKTQRKAEATAATAQAEVKILRGQLRDLSTQVHVLCFNIHAQEKGLDQLTEEEAAKFERLKRGEVTENALDDMSDTHQYITEKFVAFTNIYELQEKNQELLRVVRDLADKMENEEAMAEKQQAAQDHEEVQQLRFVVTTLQDEVKSITVRMKSYMTERDMFRRMLQQRANPAEIRAALGEDVSQREVLASIEQNSTEDADLAVAYRELQAQYDSYRNDQTTERKSLKEQIDKLSSEKGSLQAEIAKVSSQLTLATERYSMLESNFKAAQSENQQLQKRNQALSESGVKQDLRVQQIAEDLVEARGLAESLRSENANLKAEKNLWKTIQERLSQDNEHLSQEKARLNTLLTNQQSLLNERELSESEAKRRQQTQIDALEAELATTKRKLSEEMEESKKIQLRKEFDAQQYQKRIDELTTMISQVKEENVAAKTTRDHLQARVGELEVELRNAQERADRLRPLPTPRAQPAEQGSTDDDSQARIEELENEVQDLKNNIDLLNAQLENAKQQCDNFKQLSREMEEELTSANETQEQYRQQMDADLAAKDGRINELQQRVEGLTVELGNSNSELNMLRDSQADVARKFEDKERMLNGEIARLKDEEERYKETFKFHQQDLRAQAEIATKAQQDYEQELVRHAEAAKSLQQLREEHNQLKTHSAQWRAEAESAKLSLTQSEQSWEERRQQLEQEIAEIKARRDDLTAQNKLLHQQLDGVTSQITSLKQGRSAMDDSAEGAPISANDNAVEGLRELNNYLRREKEILEVQFDLKAQEAKRLQQQLEYSQSQLDEARLKLDQERRSQADSARNSLTHKELMDKLNELNLIRESNVTLRNENVRIQAQLAMKNRKIEELENRIQPLEARISELELDKTFKEAEIKQLQEARDGLQKRIESILSKYGQADPQEVEQLKASVESLQAEREAFKQAEAALEEKLKEAETNLETERTNWKTMRARLAEDFKTRFGNVKTQRNELAAEKQALQTTLDAANERLSAVEKDLESARQDLANLQAQNTQLQEQHAQAAAASAEQTVPAVPAAAAAPAEQDPQLLQQLGALRQELESVKSQKATLEAELESLRAELATAIAERDEARAEVARLQSSTHGTDTEMQDVEAPAPAQEGTGLSDEERKALEERIAAAEAKAAEFEAKAKDLEERADAIVKQRSEKMKTALNKKLAESKEAMEKQTEEERQKLQAEYDLKLQQELAILKAEQQSGVSQNGVPATPAKPPTAQNAQTPGAGTPGLLDLANLTDHQTRELISSNQVIMGIIKSNVKKNIAAESKKVREEVEVTVKAEYEQKIASAKEQAAALTEKKSALRLNMLDRQLKTEKAKTAVVETAAKETPQKPVVEVWEVAKVAKAPAPAPAPPAATPAAGAPATGQQPATPLSMFHRARKSMTKYTNDGLDAAAVVVKSAPGEETKPQITPTPKPVPAPARQGSIVAGQVVGNPFGQPGANQSPVASQPPANPFGAAPQQQQNAQQQQQQPVTNPFGAPQPQQSGQQQQQGGQFPGGQQQQNQNQQGNRTGIPVAARGGANNARGGRGAYGAQGRGGQGPRGRGGFGGRGGANAGQGGGGMNPHAGEFQPGQQAAGNKRPRGDGEGGNQGGPKRARGGGNVGGGGAGGGGAGAGAGGGGNAGPGAGAT